MAVRRVTLSSVVVLLALSCGGKTLIEPGESEARGPADSGNGNQGSSPTSAPSPGDQSNPGIRFDEGDPLGACQEGFFAIEEPKRDCNCLVEDVCFDTKAQACACICPRSSSHNTCVSAQDCEKNSRTNVTCFGF